MRTATPTSILLANHNSLHCVMTPSKIRIYSLSECETAWSKVSIILSTFGMGLFFIFIYRSRTNTGILPWHMKVPITVLLQSICFWTEARILLKYAWIPLNPAVRNRKNSLPLSSFKNAAISLLQCPLSVQNQYRVYWLQVQFQQEIQNSASSFVEERRKQHRPIDVYFQLRY